MGRPAARVLLAGILRVPVDLQPSPSRTGAGHDAVRPGAIPAHDERWDDELETDPLVSRSDVGASFGADLGLRRPGPSSRCRLATALAFRRPAAKGPRSVKSCHPHDPPFCLPAGADGAALRHRCVPTGLGRAEPDPLTPPAALPLGLWGGHVS